MINSLILDIKYGDTSMIRNCYKGEVEELNFGDGLPQVGPPMGERRPPPMGERRLR